MPVKTAVNEWIATMIENPFGWTCEREHKFPRSRCPTAAFQYQAQAVFPPCLSKLALTLTLDSMEIPYP